jgi:hypothetical protein
MRTEAHADIREVSFNFEALFQDFLEQRLTTSLIIQRPVSKKSQVRHFAKASINNHLNFYEELTAVFFYIYSKHENTIHVSDVKF